MEKGCIGNVPAANENLSALAHGVFNVPDYFLNCTCVNKGTMGAVLDYQVKETTAKNKGTCTPSSRPLPTLNLVTRSARREAKSAYTEDWTKILLAQTQV